MRRLLYYILLALAVAGSTSVVLWVPGFMNAAMGFNTGVAVLEDFASSVINGTYSWGFSAINIFTYGLILFVFTNAAILLTMLLVFLFSGFALSKIAKFYRIVAWFIFSAIIITGVYITFVIMGPGFSMGEFPLWSYIPLVASLAIMILGIILRVTERNR